MLLESRKNWEIVAEAADGNEGLHAVSRLKPDVAVVDIGMPGMDGLDLTRAVRKTTPKTKILILTEYRSRSMIDEARNAGADGYVIKSDAGSDLLPAVQALSEHRDFFTSNGTD
jgi:DNA-binding NarL/FixJ family response regulator